MDSYDVDYISDVSLGRIVDATRNGSLLRWHLCAHLVVDRLSFSLVPTRYFCMRAAPFDSFLDALKWMVIDGYTDRRWFVRLVTISQGTKDVLRWHHQLPCVQGTQVAWA